MGPIIPAILPTSREDLDAKLLALNGVTSDVQIDLIDGRFAGPASWPYAEKERVTDLPELGSFAFEIDLMVEDPEATFGEWVSAGASRITVHAETTKNLSKIIENFQRTYGHDKAFMPGMLAFGFSLNVRTDMALIEPFLDHCDYVQFMGIARIGKQGEPFAADVLPKIRAFHRKHPEMPIQVDGGVSRITLPDLLRAGVSRFVVGSDLWHAADVRSEFIALEELTHQYGLYA